MRLPIERRDGLFVAAAALVVTLYVAISGGGFPLDDSWIHQTYARNLAETGQWAFVRGMPSAASTSPMYTLLLAAGYALRVPYPLWAHGLGALALAVTAILGARMAGRLAPESRFVPLAVGLALVLTWHLVWAAASGMETMAFGMLTLALIHAAWREQDARGTPAFLRGAGFGALAAITTLTRPEGVLLAGIAGLVVLITHPQGMRWALVWAVGAAAGFAVVSAPYFAYNIRLTGGLLPDTAAAKQAENAPLLALPYPARVANLLYPLTAGMNVLLIPGVVTYLMFIVRRWRRERAALLYLVPLAWSAALVALYAARLPAPYQHGRYVIPALPAYVVCGVVGTAWLVRAGRATVIGRVLTRALALSAGAVCVAFALLVGPGAYRQDVRIIEEEMVTAARWVARNIPEDELLAVHDIGAVGYFAPRPILDLAGLVSPEVVPIILDAEPLWALMQERNARFLMALPDQLPGKRADDPRLCPIFTTNGAASRAVGERNMTVYALVWDGVCTTR